MIARWSALGTAVVLVAACSDGSEAPADSRSPRPRHAVVILIDTLRPDRLGCYGHDRNTSPHIDGLAARGVRFDRAVSPAPWTLPATGALLSALPPEQAFDVDSRLASSLVEELNAAGLATAAFTESAFVSAHFGMNRGFDTWWEEGEMSAVVDGEQVAGGKAGAGAKVTFDRAIGWLRARDETPFVLLVHTYEVHTPYRRARYAEELESGRFGGTLEIPDLRRMQDGSLAPTDDELAYVSALYDGGVRAADRHVGRLLDELDRLGLTEETLVVVTSDHGEELGDHHPAFTADHGHSLKDDLLLVPLIVADPTRAVPAGVVDWQVRLQDVLPTVADRLGVPWAGATAGRSLVAMMDGGDGRHRPAISGHTKAGVPRRSLRDGRHKLILADEGERTAGESGPPVVPRRQLYDLQSDPGEQFDVSADHPELTQELSAALRAWQRRVGKPAARLQPDAADAALRERLEALGYVK